MTKLTARRSAVCLPVDLSSRIREKPNPMAQMKRQPGENFDIPKTLRTPTGAAPPTAQQTTGLVAYAIWQPGNDVKY